MIQARRGVFETNSSSTHSITMCSEKEFNKWKSGELLLDCYNNCLVDAIKLSDEDKENAKQYYNDIKGVYWKNWEQLSEEEIKSWYNKYTNDCLRSKRYSELQTYREWCESDYLEHFTCTYTSPSGDKIVAFGKYGYDG